MPLNREFEQQIRSGEPRSEGVEFLAQLGKGPAPVGSGLGAKITRSTPGPTSRLPLLWSTKGRRYFLNPEWKHRLFAYMGFVARAKNTWLIEAHSRPDPIHLYGPEKQSKKLKNNQHGKHGKGLAQCMSIRMPGSRRGALRD